MTEDERARELGAVMQGHLDTIGVASRHMMDHIDKGRLARHWIAPTISPNEDLHVGLEAVCLQIRRK